MNKNLVLILFFLFFSKLHSQEYSFIDKELKNKYPVKESFVNDGLLWMYYPEMGDIKKLPLACINKINPNNEYYTATLTYFLDQHIEDANCIILLNKKENSISLFPPNWFDGSIRNQINTMIGYEFKDEKEIKNFIKEVENLLLIGSEMHLGKTIYKKNKITINLILKDHTDIWSKVEINLNKYKFLSLIEK